ncbi:hypothetical protein N7509_008622 [Penicillium cosmopolitanum]|uniref:Phosphoglycerate mutase n=1 Tax=Penicillium cosmopolitanum TaxID=1131564 RepID=A0A9W9VMX9_9EURO|nr:uncharacterized protein N7509_008622 [Penicillium cosmopolitanum]KAJ5386081.1 hypothetical protein N7509_008622 [Penicillium cosmopolitanum]
MRKATSFKLSTLAGYFLQDDPSTDPDTFDYAKSNFGLIHRVYGSETENSNKYSQWQKFSKEIQRLNSQAEPNTQYKVLFLGRHGEGVHNVAEKRYGTKAWDEYWSLLDGDEFGTWADARLTDVGISQAKAARAAWEEQLEHSIPIPESYYVSPLIRCCATAQVTFDGLDMPLTKPFRPVIKEFLRETMGEHTCDRRSPASTIASEFPQYQFEADFTEEDLLWDPKTRESDEDRNKRLFELLCDIFARDNNVFLSLTAHSGAITSILEVVGHRRFPLQTGGVIPVIVKVEGNRSLIQ